MSGDSFTTWDCCFQVGHTKGYIQVLVDAPESLLGASAMVRITSVGRWSVFGEVIEILNHASQDKTSNETSTGVEGYSPSSANDEQHACTKEPDSCSCAAECGDSRAGTTISTNGMPAGNQNLYGQPVRKRTSIVSEHSEKTVPLQQPQVKKSMEDAISRVRKWNFVDKALFAGIFLSFFTAVASTLFFWFRK